VIVTATPRVVERQVRRDSFQAAVPLLPAAERGFTDPSLRQTSDRYPGLGPLQRKHDLCFGELGFVMAIVRLSSCHCPLFSI
jgi:hypothetical protein